SSASTPAARRLPSCSLPISKLEMVRRELEEAGEGMHGPILAPLAAGEGDVSTAPVPVWMRMMALVLIARPVMAASRAEIELAIIERRDADGVRSDLAVRDDRAAVRSDVVVPVVSPSAVRRRPLDALPGLDIDSAEEPAPVSIAVVPDGGRVDPELMSDPRAVMLRSQRPRRIPCHIVEVHALIAPRPFVAIEDPAMVRRGGDMVGPERRLQVEHQLVRGEVVDAESAAMRQVLLEIRHRGTLLQSMLV